MGYLKLPKCTVSTSTYCLNLSGLVAVTGSKIQQIQRMYRLSLVKSWLSSDFWTTLYESQNVLGQNTRNFEC